MLQRGGKSNNKLEMIAENTKGPSCAAVQNGDLADVIPVIEFGDLYHYSITAPSPVTKNEPKAWTSMDGRNYLFSGCAGNLIVYHVMA